MSSLPLPLPLPSPSPSQWKTLYMLEASEALLRNRNFFKSSVVAEEKEDGFNIKIAFACIEVAKRVVFQSINRQTSEQLENQLKKLDATSLNVTTVLNRMIEIDLETGKKVSDAITSVIDSRVANENPTLEQGSFSLFYSIGIDPIVKTVVEWLLHHPNECPIPIEAIFKVMCDFFDLIDRGGVDSDQDSITTLVNSLVSLLGKVISIDADKASEIIRRNFERDHEQKRFVYMRMINVLIDLMMELLSSREPEPEPQPEPEAEAQC